MTTFEVYQWFDTYALLGMLETDQVPHVPKDGYQDVVIAEGLDPFDRHTELIHSTIRFKWRGSHLIVLVHDLSVLRKMPGFTLHDIVDLPPSWQIPSSALRNRDIYNGELVALLVIGEDGSHTEDDPRWRTIGSWDQAEERWCFAGWCWSHDRWIDGRGIVIGVARLPGRYEGED